jgi:tetratricopeptide (TPR) repeat protein
MKLVNQIGNAYSLSGDNEKAADIFYRLLQYIRRHLPETVTSNRMLPLVLYNFARSLDLSQKYEEGAKVARYGKEACIKYGHYQVLHSCLEIEAECDFFLGKKEESVERYREAFYICKVMGYEDDLQIIRTEAEKYLNILF